MIAVGVTTAQMRRRAAASLEVLPLQGESQCVLWAKGANGTNFRVDYIFAPPARVFFWERYGLVAAPAPAAAKDASRVVDT